VPWPAAANARDRVPRRGAPGSPSPTPPRWTPRQALPPPEQGLPPVAKPQDYLPAEDLDVSGVPTADALSLPANGAPTAPAVPSFPAPPRPAVVEGDPATDPLLAERREQEGREPGIPLAPGQIPAEGGEGPEPDEVGASRAGGRHCPVRRSRACRCGPGVDRS
jgi:hypothetical protein